MNFLSQQLEATSDVDLPAQSWARLTSAVNKIAGLLWTAGRISLRVVTPAEIRSLNDTFRGVDSETDVLSFPATENGYHGDIALNWAAVCSQASTNLSSPDNEAVALVTHGLLHLAGLTHETEADDLIMTNRTISLCKQAGCEVETFGH